MQRRIYGVETEFGVTCTFHGQRRLSPDEVARYLFRRVVSWGRSSNVFLRNGSRLYLDVGSHPEYATAECDDLIQLVTHDKAGERILEDLLVDAERRLADEGIGGDIFLFKNNTDSAGNSYGCHENYLVTRAGEFSRIADVLLPFLVTRQLICGAGKVLQTPRGAVYCLSQRAEHIWEGVSSATTRSRPIINTRDEPHADAERYRRLHVIVGDSNMSEVTTLLKIGTAHLVLEMIEAGVQFRDFTLDNPIRAIREISHDLTGRRTVRLAGGREASALDIQREYYSRAVEHVAARGSTVSRIDPKTNQVTHIPVNAAQALAAGAGSAWVSSAGGAKPGTLPASSCDDVVSGGATPDVLIASDLPLQGEGGAGPRAMVDAIRLVLRNHHFKAGKFTVGYRSCDDSTAQTGYFEARRWASNANAYARADKLVAVIGPFNSDCAQIEIPILNRAQGGPLALIGPTTTYAGLTRDASMPPPDGYRDEPHVYYPTGRRNFVRLVPGDDELASAQAVLAKQLRLKGVYVLDDHSGFWKALMTEPFQRAARRLGLRIAGHESSDPRATG